MVLALFPGQQKLGRGVFLTSKTAGMHLGNLFSSFIISISPSLSGLLSKSFTIRSSIYPKVAFRSSPRSFSSVFMSVPGSAGVAFPCLAPSSHKTCIHVYMCKFSPAEHAGKAHMLVCKVGTALESMSSKCCVQHFQTENVSCPQLSS